MFFRLDVGIHGMTCGSCVSTITEEVSKINGVREVSISLLTEEGKIVYDKSITDHSTIKQRIEECGFDVELKKEEICEQEKASIIDTKVRIGGMTCGSCSSSVTEALKKMDGIIEVSISLMTEEGHVKHEKKVSPQEIVEQIEGCGFQAQLLSSEAPGAKSHRTITKLGISGMTCGACTASVTESLEKVPDVENVVVSLITEEASITHSNNVSLESLKQAVEDCGFDCSVINSKAQDSLEEYDNDTITLQLFRNEEETDINNLHYNIEALLSSLPKVNSFKLVLKDDTESYKNVTSVDPSNTQEDFDAKQMVDELHINYNKRLLGIRSLISSLNNIDPNVSFSIINSIDQSSTSQLRLLARVKEIQYWRKNFKRSLFFGFPVIILTHTLGFNFWKKLIVFRGLYLISLIQLALTIRVYFYEGFFFCKKFYQYIKNGGRNATMEVLVFISMLVAFWFSILSMLVSVWQGQTEKPPNVLFETTCMLVIFISFGKWLEFKAKGAASTTLSKLLSITPTTCKIVVNNDAYDEFMKTEKNDEKDGDELNEEPKQLQTKVISIDLVEMNDICIVLPGEKIPADGVVIFGSSEVDESLITGESLPVLKKVGDPVVVGSINRYSLLHVRVTRTGNNSSLQQIITLVKNSQVSKAPVQKYADYIAARFVPFILILSAVTFFFWIFVTYVLRLKWILSSKMFSDPSMGRFLVCLKLGISVVVVACPCALGLAAPTAIMVGTGLGAAHGVLIKGGEVLEGVRNLDIILFDKTGTLTTGTMAVINSQIKHGGDMEMNDWWTLVGCVESGSEHPIGKAVSVYARKSLDLAFEDDSFDAIVKSLETSVGLGVKATVTLGAKSNKTYTVNIGSHKLIEKEFDHLSSEAREFVQDNAKDNSNTFAHVIINDKYCGFLEVTDRVKPHTKEILSDLQYEKGYIVGMITGDSQVAAEKVGAEVGIPQGNIFSSVLPSQKDTVIVDLKKKFGTENVGIAFVGDGINDAPALVESDVGIAIITGSDIAIESADIILVNQGQISDLLGVPNALHISKATFRRIKLNFLWAAIYNLVMLPFAMGIFVPFNLILPPGAAAAAMAFSSVSVVVSSLMLKRVKPITLNSQADYDFEAAAGTLFSLKYSSPEDFEDFKYSKKKPWSFLL